MAGTAHWGSAGMSSKECAGFWPRRARDHPSFSYPPHSPLAPSLLDVNARVCRFKVQLTLHSARPLVGGLTVTTGAAPNRLAMLDGMCSSWVGPLVVAVWLPVLAPGVASARNHTDLAVVEDEVRALFDRSSLRL